MTLGTTPDLRLCTVCGSAATMFRPGPHGKRLDASCPTCGALERHRFLALVLPALTDHAGQDGVLLDVAPMRGTTPMLKAAVPNQYVGIDFDPDADHRIVDVAASLTDVPLVDASVALMICMHVLEHIPDDRAAMREIHRVLSPTGVAVVQVPKKTGVPTDEDPSAGVEERQARFGQADHVRWYGDDFEDRLAAAGLTVTTITATDVVDPGAARMLGLPPEELLWLCSRADAATGGSADLVDAVRLALPAVLVDLLRRTAAAAIDDRERVGSGGAAAPARSRAQRSLPRRVASYAKRKLRALRA
jgi:SAM-dependent methyltransferase